jgi:hypothetical protein
MFFEFITIILNHCMFKVDLDKFPKHVQVEFIYFTSFLNK